MIDVHPVLVHFPIALLVLYSCIELFSFGSLKKNLCVVHTKISLLIFGVIFAFISLSSGEVAESVGKFVNMSELIEVHSLFAEVSTWIFAVIATSYIVITPGISLFLKRKKMNKTMIVVKPIQKIAGFLTNFVVVRILAVAGGIAIFITGALGGAIVYGPNIDPVVTWVYHLFFA